MRIDDHPDLVALLRRRGIAFEDEGEGRWLRIAADPEPIMVRWEPDAAVVQVMWPLFAVDAGERAAVAERIVALNHVLAMPGFGMDPDSGIVYFRLSVPRNLDGTLAEEELSRLIETVMSTARAHGAKLRG